MSARISANDSGGLLSLISKRITFGSDVSNR